MKKIIFLLLLSVAGYGQATNFPYGIKNPAATVEVSPTMLTTHGATNVYGKVSVNNLPVSIAVQDSLDKKLNISDLPTNLTLYPTTTASDVGGYVVMVTDIHDVRYNSTAVDVSTPAITTTAQLVSQRISDAGVLVGQPGVFNVTTFGSIRRLSGSGTATFFFRVYHRDAAGVETLIGQSSDSEVVTSSSYLEFSASMVWNDGEFSATDRIVIKSYANRIVGGSDPVYQFQFGGIMPVRTLLPVPFSVVDAGYEIKDNKSNAYVLDGTGQKYYTADYLNDKLPTSYAKIVYVNSTSTNTATIFDLANPPVTNDNLLKNDVANLYIGTDASTWVYNGLTYITKMVPDISNFYLYGTTIAAGSNKNNSLYRSGGIFLGGDFQAEKITSVGSMLVNTTIGSGLYKLEVNGSALVDKFKYTRGTDVSNTDLNSLIDAGFYSGDHFTNSPDGTTGTFHITVERYEFDTSYAHQTATSFFGNVMYSRIKAGSWGPWMKMSYTDSPSFTGTPTAPTAAPGTNDNTIANAAFVQAAITSDTKWTVTGINLRNNNIGETFIGNSDTFGFTYDYGLGVSGKIATATGFIGNIYADLSEFPLMNSDGGGNASIYGGNVVVMTTDLNRVSLSKPLKLKSYTVATLPTGVQGDTAYVTDALTPTYLGTLTGGGSVVCPVFYNGTAWVAH